MEPGFILDESYGKRGRAKWVEGEPRSSIWTGLKLRGKERLTLRPIAAAAAAISKATPNASPLLTLVLPNCCSSVAHCCVRWPRELPLVRHQD